MCEWVGTAAAKTPALSPLARAAATFSSWVTCRAARRSASGAAPPATARTFLCPRQLRVRGTAPMLDQAFITRAGAKQCVKGRASGGSQSRPLMMRPRSSFPRETTVVDITCSSPWDAWQRRGYQQEQHRVIMLAVGVLYGHLLGAQRALAAAAAAAPLVLRKVVLCEMEVV